MVTIELRARVKFIGGPLDGELTVVEVEQDLSGDFQTRVIFRAATAFGGKDGQLLYLSREFKATFDGEALWFTMGEAVFLYELCGEIWKLRAWGR